MNGFTKALMGMIHVSMNRLLARRVLSGITSLPLAGIVLVVVGGASAGEQGGIGCVNSTGWAYQCGDTVTESCTFNGDLSCESDHGLVISADGITIDGAGHTMTGNRSDCPRCSYTFHQQTYCGILNGAWFPPNVIYDGDNVVIKNLEVKNFCIGIAIQGVHNNTIFNCSVHHNGAANVTYTYGITVLYSDHITIDDCSVYNNTGIILDSVTTAGHGIHFYENCDHCNVTDSFIANNYLSGIWASAYGCSNLYIANNTVENNGICGGSLMDSTSGINLHWEGCVPSPRNSVVENNRVLNNTGAGIYAAQNTITIKDNVVTGTKNGTGYAMGHGISIRSSGGHGRNINIYNNIFCDNEGWDIYDDIPGSSNTGDNNTCDTTYNYNDTGTTGCTYECVHRIVIRDAANGEGSEITMHTMTTAEDFHAWCAGYDANSNYINDVPCTWNTTGTLDPIPAGPSTSAIFSPSTSDTNGTITAVCGQGYTDNTGTITVEAEGGCVGLITGHVYHCGEIVTESCTLSGNMRGTNNTKPGLYIGADNVVIDGNSFSMTGAKDAIVCRSALIGSPGQSMPAKHSGIYNGYDGTIFSASYDNVVIKDLEITNFCTGIAAGDGLFATDIDNMTVTGCFIHDCGEPTRITHGIHMVYTNNCDIIKNNISNIQGTGGSSCSGGGNGIFMYGSGSRGKHNTITRNNLSYNAKSGFFMKMQCMYNTISSNTATENAEGGIVLRCMMSNYNTIEGNNASGNGESGIYIGGKNNTIRHNMANDNGYAGINMARDDGSYNNEVYENTACRNENTDIRTCGSRCYGNHGDDNTCDTTYNYDDTGTTGCTFDCSPAPDLTITEKSEEWIDQTNKTYNITYTVKNIGDAGASISTTSIRMDGVEAATDPVPALAPDESYISTLSPFTMSDGSNVIRVCADRDNVVMEKSKEYNNCLENVFWYPEMPDLVITEKSEEWVDLENKTYNITCTVKNIGNANANKSTTAIIIDGTEVATDLIEALPPQATHITELGPFTMSDDSDTIRICADKNNIVEEDNEDNNCLENIFEFHGKPDLVISKKYEEWVASNETYWNYTITYTIKNIGTGDANESTTSIKIDGTEAATDPVGALDEGESYQSTLGPFTMSGVNDTIRICADNESLLDEENEDNNFIENTFDYSEIGCVADDSTLFRCGNTVTKSCIFNGDITCPDAGLIIGTDGITIDGNDYKIAGSATSADCGGAGESSPCTASGIYNSGFDNAMIKNLEIEEFCTGIALTGVCNITVNNCSLHDNGFNTGNMATHGIHASNIAEGSPYEPALTITDNDIYNNEGTGAACGDGGNGIFIYAGSGDKHEYCNISHNKLHHNAKSGFWTKMMLTRSEITHNEVWGNGYGTGVTDDQRGGIVLRCAMSNENLIAHNDVHDNDVDGIFIGGSSNTIEYNNVTNNTDDGIDMGRSDGSYDNELYENMVCENWYRDISTFGAGSNTIGDDNTCDTTKDYDDTGNAGCTYSCGSAGICGDVDGLPGVTTNDGRQIFMYLLHGEEAYPLADTWAADCDGLCDGITTNDGRQIFMHLLHDDPDYPEDDQYPLNCSC